MVQEIMPNVYWVGVVDWGITHFHGHELSTHRGTSYNAYLILDEKIALVDTVWGPFAEDLIANIRQVADPAKIDYVIANHAEVDHSGGLPAVMAAAPKARMIVSQKGADSIPGHYHADWELQSVSTGDSISLGENELVFIEAPMLHWPDSMFTYLTGKNLLMPNDAFGQHYATAFRFNDQVNQEELFEEALKYYANILTPFSRLVPKKIEELLALKVPVDMIAPSHGVIWRDNPLQIVEKYQQWAAQQPEPRAVVLYDTMWQATRKMAEAIAEGLAEAGVDSKLFHMATADRNDVLTEVFQAKAIVIGSPTLNNGILPSLTPILEDLRGLRFQNKIGAAFGSYGWAGGSVKRLEQELEAAKIPLVREGVAARWQPTEDDLAECRKLGADVAAAVKQA